MIETFNVCLDWTSFTVGHVWTCPDGKIGKVVSVLSHPLICHSPFHIHRIITLEVTESHG